MSLLKVRMRFASFVFFSGMQRVVSNSTNTTRIEVGNVKVLLIIIKNVFDHGR